MVDDLFNCCNTIHQNPLYEGVLMKSIAMDPRTRSLSPQESRVVLALTEHGRREATREDILRVLGGTPKAVDHVIESLRRKGWLERATWGKYLLVPPEQGPDAIGDSNLLALASRIVEKYYIGFGTAAAHYGLTTQHRHTIFVATPARRRGRRLGDSRVRLITQAESKFFGFEPVDVLGYTVMMSDREKTALDCIDHPDLAGGVGEATGILANASRRFDWTKVLDYLERIDSGALVRRVGWLLDYLKVDVPPDARARLFQLAERSRKTWLGTDPVREKVVPRALGFDETWRVFVNVPDDELRGSSGLVKRKAVKKDH